MCCIGFGHGGEKGITWVKGFSVRVHDDARMCQPSDVTLGGSDEEEVGGEATKSC
jgi:hypothetical protein